MLRKIFIILILAFFANNITYAQVNSEDVTLILTPENPKAGDKVTAKIQSYTIDINKSYIIWKLNDETKLNGIGKNEFNFTLGELSSQNLISVNIETLDGKTLTKTREILGSDLDLVWESINSYIPPFYKGKMLFSREGEVKVVAIPNTSNNQTKTTPNTLSYTWKKDGNNDVKSSGFGKNYFIYKNSFLDKVNEISVNVTDINNKISLSDTILITPSEPKIVIYKKQNEIPKLEQSIKNNFYVKKEGETLVALPYFFNPTNINSNDLKISWFVNGEQILNTVRKNELFVKPAEGKNGQANVRVIIENIATLFQNKDKILIVNF